MIQCIIVNVIYGESQYQFKIPIYQYEESENDKCYMDSIYSTATKIVKLKLSIIYHSRDVQTQCWPTNLKYFFGSLSVIKFIQVIKPIVLIYTKILHTVILIRLLLAHKPYVLCAE